VKTTINVTQEHIDKGKKISCSNCPVALAIGERVTTESVYVHPRFIYLGKLMTERDLPKEAQRFIRRFDGEKEVEPFSFDLDIPDELLAEAK
jgi:hypothetical protein